VLWRQAKWNRLIDVLHGLHILLAELALALVSTLLAPLTLKECLAVLVNLQLGDHTLAGVDSNIDGGTWENMV
jgi:hypothetical protein